jgi:hypothetical protein
MSFVYTVDPATARLFGLDRVILGVNNWGDTGAHWADPTSVEFIVPFSVSGIAIEQSSEVDIVNVESVTPAGEVLLLDFVSVERPMIGDIQGPFKIKAHPSTLWSDVYEPSNSQTPETFGPDLNALFLKSWGGFVVPHAGPDTPTLHVVLYLKPPLYTPRRRATYYSHNDGQAVLAPPGAIQRALPMFGRSSANLTLKALGSPGDTAAVKVSGIVGGGTSNDDNSCYEVDLGTDFSFTMAVPNSKEVVVDCRGLSWLLIKTEQANGSPTIAYRLEAND